MQPWGAGQARDGRKGVRRRESRCGYSEDDLTFDDLKIDDLTIRLAWRNPSDFEWRFGFRTKKVVALRGGAHGLAVLTAGGIARRAD
jgi:hypothetical protein